MEIKNIEEQLGETGVICPVCGCKSVETLMHLTNPPQSHYRCPKCGYHKDVWHEKPAPFVAPL